MARSTATITTELQQDNQELFHLMELHFEGAGGFNDLFLTDNSYDIELDTPTQSSAKTYTAAGDLLSFSAVQETTNLAVNTITIALSGIDNSASGPIIAKLLEAPIINRRVVIYRSFGVTSSTDLTKTFLIFDGNVKSWSLDEGTTNSGVSLTVSTHWANFSQKNGRLTNTTTQRNTQRYGSTQTFDSDRGLEYSSAQIADIKWGPSN